MSKLHELFKDEIWMPSDYTDCYWYETTWGVSWSEEGDVENPDEWESGGYSTDRVRCKVVRDGYVLIDMDDDCGGQYQAIFDLSKKVVYE